MNPYSFFLFIVIRYDAVRMGLFTFEGIFFYFNRNNLAVLLNDHIYLRPGSFILVKIQWIDAKLYTRLSPIVTGISPSTASLSRMAAHSSNPFSKRRMMVDPPYSKYPFSSPASTYLAAPGKG